MCSKASTLSSPVSAGFPESEIPSLALGILSVLGIRGSEGWL